MIFALRIDHSFNEVKAFLDAKSIGGFAVREVAGANEHWHFLLEAPLTIKQLRPQLLRAVSALTGNGAYSLTECRDVDKYERYMAKGESEGAGYDLAWRNSIKYNDEKLEELHGSYWKANRLMRKRTSGSVVDYVVDECKRQNIQWNERSKIAEVYIRRQVAHSKPFSKFAAAAVVNVVECLLCPNDQAVQNFAEGI